MSLCSQEHWSRVESALSYPWGQTHQSSKGGREAGRTVCGWRHAIQLQVTHCIFPANMTNADEADEIDMLRKKRTSIIMFQCSNPIKQKLHTNEMKKQSKEQL